MTRRGVGHGLTFALLYGGDSRQLDEWSHASYVDVCRWVATPTVVKMRRTAGIFATEPYAASAYYISRMGDCCPDCPYAPDDTTGGGSCPFSALCGGP
ncbi:hypothetical protein [Halomicrococcus sp. NG-SE-24]|uniref:hypothetical protein n=1 Tax=Halomicrococcus sp. NG-SE-24 TaxID=3436928 RepID=UPI003D97C991